MDNDDDNNVQLQAIEPAMSDDDNGLNEGSPPIPYEQDKQEQVPLQTSSSAAQATVKQTLYSDPKDNVQQEIEEKSESEEPSQLMQIWSANKKFLPYVLLILVIAYSLAAFIIDFERARVLFIIECIVVVFQGTKFIYTKWFAGSATRVLNKFLSNRILVIVMTVVFICLVLTIFILSSYNDPGRLVALLGLAIFILLCWALSWHRSKIKWRPVIWGFGLQFTFALLILRTEIGFELFEYLGEAFGTLLDFTLVGSQFTFGYLADSPADPSLEVFAFSVIPTVIFFSSLVSVLYYLGWIQVLIYYISITMQYTLGTSSSESLNAAGNIFVGMTEAPLLIRPFLADMTRSELHAVMTGGFATIAGGVLAIYISFGVPASHLLSASVMSAPAALAISKIVYPEVEISPTAQRAKTMGGNGKNDDDEEEEDDAEKVLKQIGKGNETNVIEAASNGAAIAIGLAANIIGMLIAFLALIAMLDYLFAWWGSLINWDISFTKLCGYIFYPVALMMGIRPEDCQIAGELIGQKVIANEFVAYLGLLGQLANITKRSEVILIYALCGFSNFGAIGITLGGLTPLAPTRTKDLTQLVLSAMICGNVACFMTACIAALLFDESKV